MSSTEKRHVEVPWLAKPSGDCCLKGHLHTGTPRGKFETIASVDTYITSPTLPSNSNGHILFYFADVYGMFTNAQLVMDSFADAGYLVLGLDYFNNDPIFLHRDGAKQSKPGFDFEAWKEKYAAFAAQKVPEWIDEVKRMYGKSGTKYACVGYCFGAPYVCNSLASSESNPPTCHAGAFAHPAFLKDSHFENLSSPLFLSCAEIDHTFPTESRNKAIDLMDVQGKMYTLQVFKGVEHGFALRANLDDPYQRWCKEHSLKGIVDFFDFWLAQ